MTALRTTPPLILGPLVALLLPWLCTGVLRADPTDDSQRLDQQRWDQMERQGRSARLRRSALKSQTLGSQQRRSPGMERPVLLGHVYFAGAKSQVKRSFKHMGQHLSSEGENHEPINSCSNVDPLGPLPDRNVAGGVDLCDSTTSSGAGPSVRIRG